MVSKAPRTLLTATAAPHRDSRATGTCIKLPTTDSDLAAVRSYSRELKIACDELHDDPFNPEARAHLIRLIQQDSKTADAAKERLHGHQVPTVSRPSPPTGNR